MTGKTVSSVQSASAAMDQRQKAFVCDQCALNAFAMYAQIIIGFALYLYDHVSTPGWISLLLTFPYLFILIWLSSLLLGRCRAGENLIFSAVGKGLSSVFYFLFSFVFFIDALLAFYALCAIMRDVMPDHSAWTGSVFIAVICFLSIKDNQANVLPCLGRFLKWLVGGLLLYCFAIALPYGKTAHFFPLLGYGTGSIFQGALWMCGALSTAAAPLLLANSNEKKTILDKNAIVIRPFFLAFLLALLTYWISVWLLPVYAMARPEAFGWRLLLVTHMTPSVPAWSMEVISLILLFLLSLCHSVSQASRFFSLCMKKEKEPRFLAAFFLAFMIPIGALRLPEIHQFFLSVAPWRGGIALCLLLLLWFASILHKKEAEQ